ncbi:kelch repeat protein [Ancylostoma ceylanicum]|uniref:Kelch repeat protein n=1 Tax=Ancylostoma ceylanicum TaxID=53326 RepID=A0A0D6LAW6_9BILA|nr:kelch repeat protein [Ancylostoma ceylanicum]
MPAGKCCTTSMPEPASEGHSMVIDEPRSTQFFASLRELRADGRFCDVELLVGSHVIKAHRGIDYPTLSSLIEYAYGGSLTITEDSAQTIMAAASYLELLDVTEKCGIFICEHLLDAGNALVLRVQFSSLGCKTATMEVERFIDKNFVPISCTEKFLELSVEEVTELLSKDQLHVASEEEVFSAAMRWVEHSPVRTNMLERVLTCVRLHLLDRNFLVNEVARHPTIRGSNTCREMVEDVKDFHLISAKASASPLLSRSQRCNDCSWAIFVAGGRVSKKLLSTVEKYDPVKNRWEYVLSMPTSRAGLGLAVHGGVIYAAGGKVTSTPRSSTWTSTNKIERYDVVKDCWEKVYDPKDNSWRAGVPMSSCPCADAVVALDGYIYALSAWTVGERIFYMERFSPEIGRWEEMPKMGKERTFFGATAMNGKIYVCGGTKHM